MAATASPATSRSTRSIDDRPARHLPEQADAADRKHEADLDLSPFLRCQVPQRTDKAGLNVGERR
jgi:hypothetical protein